MPGEFEGQRVTVMGLGRFGGGVGVTRFLCGRGADVLVTDLSPADQLADSVAKLRPLIDAGQVTLRLGEHNVSDFTTCDMVVVNPAVPPGNRFIRAAEAAGIPVTTEVRLLVERLPNRLRTIGVTGSAGKSTVTAMIGHVLNKVMADGGGRVSDVGWDDARDQTSVGSSAHPTSEIRNPKSPRVWVGGNIGGSLLERVDEIGPEDWVVLELSSFMLERLRDQPDAPGYSEGRSRGWSPHIAVVTNISENHLDWHGSMADYVAAKQVILEYQQVGDCAYLGGVATGFEIARGVVRFHITDTSSLRGKMLHVPGEHNRLNAMFPVSIIGSSCLMSREQVIDAIADFPGLPHRLEFVGEFDGVKYYNDSKCTTPAAARLAVEAFTETGGEKGVGSRFLDGAGGATSDRQENDSRPLFPGVHLILGGYDKGSDLSGLAGFARGACRAVYTIGATGEGVARAAETAAEAASAGADVVRCGTLEKAVEAIRGRVETGDVVLLSPGCASWDQFENYEARGSRFIELVRGSVGVGGS